MVDRFSFRYQPVLGTELHVVVGCDDVTVAEASQQRVLTEIVRLEGLLSTYRADTPLARWMAGEPDDLPAEVVAVLSVAQEWFVRSGGLLHPGLGHLRTRWERAEREGTTPDAGECRELAAASAVLPFAVQTHEGARRVERVGDCRDVDLDALAKGWIVDRAAEVGLGPDVSFVLVNVGGDLRLIGSGSTRVAIEDPRSDVDNAPPLTVVTMTAGGLASSGQARRGFQVGERWFGHVLDPRTGWPVAGTAGVTVIADDTVTADAWATVVGVTGLDHPATTALAAGGEPAVLTVSDAGEVVANQRWRELLRPA